MSKRSEGHGVDGTSSTSEGLVSNPLAYASSADKNEGETNELGPLQQQQSEDAESPQNDGNPADEAAAIVENHSSDDDTGDFSTGGVSPDSSSPSQRSPQYTQSITSDQTGSFQQRKRQLPLEHESLLDPNLGADFGGQLGTDEQSTSTEPSKADQSNTVATEKSNFGSSNGKIEAQDDSENTDQEVPLPDDRGGNQTVTWMPQNEQSLCEFSHTIADYSQKRDSGCKKAEYSDVTVDDRGNKWRLIVYVNGNGRASNHHLSLFLQVADADDLPFGWKKAVSYVLTLEHPGDGSLSYAKRNPDKTFKLCPKAIDWGWSQFITSDKIQQEGFVQNDSLVVRASVTVKSSSVTIDADDAELYLKCAVEEGKPDAVQLCLDQGASVNCQFKDDLYTPLHTACSISPADQENGDDENSKSPQSSTASIEGSMKVLELLLEKGADGNACNKWKETPLLIAANNGHKNAVEALLKYGADPALCSEAGWSALTFAAHKGYDEIVALLLDAGAPINCPVSEDSSTPLHKACAGAKSGHLSAVKLLLDGGADVHALNKWQETPLLTAANHGQAGAVEALLRAGADPCKCTDTGWSPLSIAAYKGHNDVVKLLLEEGAPTEESDPTLSALLQAATKGLPETVELLLQHGADHTVTTKKGDTALSILVEQNLIDAAVEMVTRYKASIPRCSRDRKKVQKAKLLINLRVKQQQQRGVNLGSNDDYNDDSDVSEDGLPFEGDSSVTQAPTGRSEDQKPAMQGRKTNKKVSAEEQAKAAEEALLMELELEDAERNKQEKEANKKLAKKRKKKERERQVKKEQEEKRLAEERAEEEKRREEHQARESAKKAERERLAAAQRKQEQEFRRKREEDIRKQQKEEEKRRRKLKEEDEEKAKARQIASTIDSSSPNGRNSRQDKRNDDRTKTGMAKGRQLRQEDGASSRSTSNISTRPKPAIALKKRGWESLPSVNPPSKSSPIDSDKSKTQTSIYSKPKSEVVSVSVSLGDGADAAGGMTPSKEPNSLRTPIGKPSRFFDAASAMTPPMGNAGATSRIETQGNWAIASLEPPAVAVFRREKILELLHRCSLAHLSNDVLGSVDDMIIRIVILRWIARAAHENSECFDFIIPSWVDLEKLTSFFQRQFITESRKGTKRGTPNSMEALKEAGAKMATMCQELAKSVLEYRRRVELQLSGDWNDGSVGMSSSDIVRALASPIIIVDWSRQSQVHLPTAVFLHLKERYRGSSSNLLSSIFVSKVCYDTVLLLSGESPTDFRLLPNTKAKLASHLHIDSEVWIDPFSVAGGNRFFGRLPCIDQIFGGSMPYGTSEENDRSLFFRGGSVMLLVPPDNMIATRYIRHTVDMLLSTPSIPLSFAIFIRPDCLVDVKSSVTIDDLYTFDPRLREKVELIRRIDILAAGRHAFFSEKLGAPAASSTGSLFVVLQNTLGRSGYPLSDVMSADILDSMKFDVGRHNESSESASLAFPASTESFNPRGSLWGSPSDYAEPAVANIPASPLSYQPAVGANAVAMERNLPAMGGSIPGTFPSNNSPTGQRRSVPRRGRLFDLVDDGGEEDNINDVVSGMLGTLNVDLFQNTGAQDVDIEAISLMGIGGPSASTNNTLQPRGASSQGRFG